MASQFRWTSKSVDLLHRVVSVASLRQRGLGDLLGREQEDLEGTGDDGTLRQRRVEFRHGASAAKSPCRCCTAPVQASSFNGLRCPSWSVGRGLGGEREEHGKLPAMAGGQGELPPTEGGYVPSPTTAVSFGFWSGHQPPAPQASGTTIRSSLAGDPGFPSARCGSAPSRPLLARQARGCFVRQDERLRVLGFQMLRLPPFTSSTPPRASCRTTLGRGLLIRYAASGSPCFSQRLDKLFSSFIIILQVSVRGAARNRGPELARCKVSSTLRQLVWAAAPNFFLCYHHHHASQPPT